MRRLMITAIATAVASTLPGLVAAADATTPRPFTVHDLLAMERLSDPQVSPDGRWIAYVQRSTDLEANRGRTDLWRVAFDGSRTVRLTTDPAGDWSPRWSPDGEWLYFLSSRSDSSAVWRLPTAGGGAEKVTDLSLDVGGFTLSPDGGTLVVSLETFSDCEDLACTVDRLEESAESKATGVLYDRLFVRHWDVWKDGRRSQLFAVPVDGGEPIALTAQLAGDVPSKPFGGHEEIAFTPDGSGVVFTARVGEGEPWSTDFDLYHVPIDGSEAPRPLTVANEAWDTQPVFSPDGKTLAYLAMSRPGYESDRLRIVLRDWPSGGEWVLAQDWDRSAGGISFSEDGASLLVTANDVGQVPLFAIDVASGAVRKLVAEGHVRSPQAAAGRIVFGRDDLRSPVELYSIAADGGDLRKLTGVNDVLLSEVGLGEYEQFSFSGAEGDTVWGFLVKPAGFEAGRKYPLAFLIHGGPQGSFNNTFHYRWNAQTYAGAGYAAVMIDFHGSTGYGQAFTDSIGRDWGGKPLEDLKKGLAAVAAENPWIDTERACALGASYGGYMINWIAGNWSDGFDCLVNHDGVFDQRSMYYSTEELWFPEWEHGGPYWRSVDDFEKHNPVRFVDRWKTPMLVIHGALDFRVPETQGLAAFTALQRQGIPSRFLYFPDENHWVLKPANSILWHETVLDWLAEWTGSAEAPAAAE